MQRRRFLLLLGAAHAAPWVRAAPRSGLPTVAILSLTTPENFKGRADAFRRGMRAAGQVEGRTVRLEWRHGNDQPARLEALAREIAALSPAVMLADSSLTLVQLRHALGDTPIVMAAADDPVGSRFVRSLEKPETLVTGLSAGNPDEILKAVAYLREVVPKGAPVAALLNQNNATYRKIRARFRHAALEGGLQPVMLDANLPGEIAAAFEAARRERAAGFVVMSDAMYYNERRRIVRLAAAARRPAIHPDRAFVDAGGLMSHGARIEENFERAASFVDRILRGAAPRDLPVEEPKAYRLTLNRRAAREIGLVLPQALLKQAHAVIG